MNAYMQVRDKPFEVIRMPLPGTEEGIHTLLVVVLRPETTPAVETGNLQAVEWDEEPTWEDAECL